MPPTSRTLVPAIVAVCRKLAASGFVAATDGNVSARVDSRTILITRSGLSKGETRPTDVVTVKLDGTRTTRGPFPSSEVPTHIALYRASEDIRAVVHAHPPYATAFAVSGTRLTPNVFPELVIDLGDVPLVRYAMPSSDELGTLVARHAEACHGALLANHGAISWGSTLEEAFRRMEKLEHAAHIEWVARMLGGVRQLSQEQVSLLRALHPHARGSLT